MSLETISFVQLEASYRRPYRRLGWALLLIGLAATVLVWAILRANSARHFEAARALSQPDTPGELVDGASLQAASRHLDQALRFAPRHPDYLDLAGQLRELQALQVGVVGTEQRALLEAAAGYFRQAIAARPRWPYSWANLLSVKSLLGEVDAEFMRAMERATELGPWEPQVQLSVLEISLRHWDALDPATRQRARDLLGSAYRVQPGQVVQQIGKYGRPDLLCPEDANNAAVRDYCQRTKPSPAGQP